MTNKYRTVPIGTGTETDFLSRKMVFDSNLCAPYWVLSKVLGKPHVKAGSHDTITSWRLRSDSENDFFEVLDVSEIPDDGLNEKSEGLWHPDEVVPHKTSSDPLYVWRILATDESSGETFCRWLSEMIIQEVKKSVKTLSAEEKSRLNHLLSSGVSLDKAMSSIKLEQMDVAQAYRWPTNRDLL